MPTGKLLKANPKGRGHTQIDVDYDNKYATPRLFTSEKDALASLRMWLRGVHRQEWEDGICVYNPKVPRIKEDMEVIWIELITEEKDHPV